MDIQEIKDNFELFDDWEDKYIYLIELGNKLPEFEDNKKLEKYLVKGCQSRVWLIADEYEENGKKLIRFEADSDSQIVKGLIFILISVFSNKHPQQILDTDIDSILQELSLEKHLSGNRTNGLKAMVQKIFNYAGESIK
jgi:cysteine desulfuration protein SufE